MEWHKVKDEVKHEDQQLLLDKVALQQELIKSHDQLYQLNLEQVENKKKQVDISGVLYLARWRRKQMQWIYRHFMFLLTQVC